jgi:hypothetical protein
MLDKVLAFLSNKASKNIEALYVGNNFLTSPALIKLMTVIIRLLPHIKRVDLTFSSIEQPTLKKIAELLGENKSLELLELKGCNLNLDDLHMLNEHIAKNEKSTLKELRVSLNRFT